MTLLLRDARNRRKRGDREEGRGAKGARCRKGGRVNAPEETRIEKRGKFGTLADVHYLRHGRDFLSRSSHEKSNRPSARCAVLLSLIFSDDPSALLKFFPTLNACSFRKFRFRSSSRCYSKIRDTIDRCLYHHCRME